MKLDFDSLCDAANSAGEPWHRKTIRAVWLHLARELASAGAPEAALDIQLRALLASHDAISKAVEEMPTNAECHAALDVDYDIYDVVAKLEDTFRPIIARLRKERDEAREQYEREFRAHGHTNVLYGEALVARDAARGKLEAQVAPLPSTCDMWSDLVSHRDGARAFMNGMAAVYTDALAALDANNREAFAAAWDLLQPERGDDLDRFGAQRMMPPDEPIADPAERARLVARELLARGIWARDMGNGVVIGKGKEFWYSMLWEDVAMMGVRAITDRIQREEAKRAQVWAGDEQ